MKSRALTILSLSFAALLFSRAYAVSSEVVNTSAGEPLNLSEEGPSDHSPGDGTKTNDPEHEQCLTGSIHKIVVADMDRLAKRTAKVEDREAALAQLEKSLQGQLAQIEAANDALGKKINSLKSTAGDDLKHLVSMYETMKPKQASEIFNSMDPAFAAGFLREMNSNTAGLIMANMDARKSYTISVLIAGKNANYR